MATTITTAVLILGITTLTAGITLTSLGATHLAKPNPWEPAPKARLLSRVGAGLIGIGVCTAAAAALTLAG